MKRFFPLIFLFLIISGGLLAQSNLSLHHDALRKLIEKADSGDAKAIYDLAKLHDVGFDSIKVDSIKSSELYLMAAQKGYPPAMNFIGFRYYTGQSMKKDVDSAIYWISKAGELGDITAAANLGFLLTEGENVNHDDDMAAYWLAKASKGGVREAQFKLIELMDEKWKTFPSDSVFKLGIDYYTDKAPIAGARLLEIASEAGNIKATAILADAYSKGLGLPYDHQKALEFFYKAALAGEPSAQFIVAELLDFFPDSFPDFVEDGKLNTAKYWYEKAAEAGITDADTAYQRLFQMQ